MTATVGGMAPVGSTAAKKATYAASAQVHQRRRGVSSSAARRTPPGNQMGVRSSGGTRSASDSCCERKNAAASAPARASARAASTRRVASAPRAPCREEPTEPAGTGAWAPRHGLASCPIVMVTCRPRLDAQLCTMRAPEFLPVAPTRKRCVAGTALSDGARRATSTACVQSCRSRRVRDGGPAARAKAARAAGEGSSGGGDRAQRSAAGRGTGISRSGSRARRISPTREAQMEAHAPIGARVRAPR